MKLIKSETLVEAHMAAIRTDKTLVSCVLTDDDLQGVRYAVFLTRKQLESIQPALGDFLSFEIRKQDLGDC